MLNEAVSERPPYLTDRPRPGRAGCPNPPRGFFNLPHLFIFLVVSYLMEKFLARKPRLRHDTPGWVKDPEYFVTICCQPPGHNQLCKKLVAKFVFESFCFYHHKDHCRIELLVLMPDHLHVIVKLPDSMNLASWINSLKRWISRKKEIRFQETFFDHRLRSPASAQQKWNYVNMNPVRAGYVSRAIDWPYRYTLSDFQLGRAGCP